MRILIDTNILISAYLFPNRKISETLSLLSDNHELILCSYVIEEFYKISTKKFKKDATSVESFLESKNYNFLASPLIDKIDKSLIRDTKDYPILYTALYYNLDGILTGDKDFKAIDEHLIKVYTIKELLNITLKDL